jgi:hypothetical protein
VKASRRGSARPAVLPASALSALDFHLARLPSLLTQQLESSLGRSLRPCAQASCSPPPLTASDPGLSRPLAFRAFGAISHGWHAIPVPVEAAFAPASRVARLAGRVGCALKRSDGGRDGHSTTPLTTRQLFDAAYHDITPDLRVNGLCRSPPGSRPEPGPSYRWTRPTRLDDRH